MHRELGNIKPSTLDGIKRLAKSIGRRDRCKHSAALDAAARQAGHADYRAALAAMTPR